MDEKEFWVVFKLDASYLVSLSGQGLSLNVLGAMGPWSQFVSSCTLTERNNLHCTYFSKIFNFQDSFKFCWGHLAKPEAFFSSAGPHSQTNTQLNSNALLTGLKLKILNFSTWISLETGVQSLTIMQTQLLILEIHAVFPVNAMQNSGSTTADKHLFIVQYNRYSFPLYWLIVND